jgi:thiopeptide-type bacteriocin biosynthesis protein
MKVSKRSFEVKTPVAYQPAEIFSFRAPSASTSLFSMLAAAKYQNDLESLLNDFFEEPEHSFALKVATEDLFNAWCKENAERSSNRNKVYRKLLNYAIRMCTRPTPFGSFASVGVGNWTSQSEISVTYGDVRKHCRLDMGWLLTVKTHLNSIDLVRQQVEYSLHPTCFQFGGRIYLNHIGGEHGLSGAHCKSIKKNRMVTEVMRLADSQVPYKNLVNLLTDFAGEEKRGSVTSMIDSLIDQGFLISSLEPDPSDRAPAETLLAKISQISGAETLAKHLSNLIKESYCLEKQIADIQLDQFDKIKNAAAEVSASAIELSGEGTGRSASGSQKKFENQHIFQLDSTFSGSEVCLPEAVSTAIAKMAEVFLHLSTFPSGVPQLNEAKKRFLEKYGEHRCVPVLEVLDPDIGVGNPYDLSAVNAGGPYSTQRDSHLNFLFSRALKNGEKEIQLTGFDLELLKTRDHNARLPESLDTFVFLYAKSRAALSAGDFKIAPGPYGMAFTAGRALGRFAYYFKDTTALKFREVFLSTTIKGENIVQMVCLPQRSRSSNVVLSPLMRDTALYLNCVPGKRVSGEDKYLFPRDVTVGVKNGKWHLRSMQTGDTLNVFAAHLLNLASEPPLVRFLIDASRDGAVYPLSFSWGSLTANPFVPRISYDNMILSPATWQVDTSKFEEKSNLTKFVEEFELYRQEWDIPTRCITGVGDNRLLLDFSNSIHFQIFHNHVISSPTSTIQIEEAFELDDFGWTEQNNNTYITEIVSSLFLRKPNNVEPTQAEHVMHSDQPSTFSFERKKVPGTEWLYLKLYAISQLEEDLITNDLLPFGESLVKEEICQSWYFVRYSDQRKHLRVRFRTGDSAAVIFQRVSAWASQLMQSGQCTEFAFDTYDREIERYGGTAMLNVIEKVFHADSVACAHMLSLTRNKTALSDERLLAAIESISSLVLSVGTTQEKSDDFFRQYKHNKNLTSADYRRLRGAISLLPGISTTELDKPSPITQYLQQRSKNIAEIIRNAQSECIEDGISNEIVASIVHMSLNRFLGLNRDGELKVLGLLYRASNERNKSSKQFTADRKSAISSKRT